VWKLLLGSNLATVSQESDPKTEFTEDEMHGFTERLKQWILAHPKEVATLIACIGAAPHAIFVAPVVIGLLGFGPLSPVAGKLYPLKSCYLFT
jgi:uncharacterized RDD family membrane protein YckC